MLSVKNLVKIYKQKKAEPVRALDGVSIDFADTGLVFLLGKSGSGKSTLLNAIGGLDTFDEGEIIIKGKSSKDFTQSDFDSYRNTFIGFIFQEYNILENFTVEKNLALAIELQGKKPNKEEIYQLLEQVDMIQYAKRKPNQLSGGQKQRVAIARALVKHPEIIMADEPTGALDSNTGKQVMETLKKLSKEKLVIIVSHDREFAEYYGDRIIELKDGKIISDVTKKEIEAQETSGGIKIIDDSILYIKKGQEISDGDLKKIANIINENSKKADTFISFDEKANQELKRGASITDDGNREKFEKTTDEDVKLKAYNGNSLKLIKSRLKFSDSFKMGASSLKNKVGKLVFTILLSFLAFTVFGVIDALSCWNRADSVYQAMQITGQKTISMRKGVRQDTWIRDESTLKVDLKDLQEEFPHHVIKGVVNGGYYQPGIYVEGYELSSVNNPLWQTTASGYVSLTDAERQKMGLEIEGRLPENNKEVCISKHMFETFVKRTSEKTNKIERFSDFDPTKSGTKELKIRVDGYDNYYSDYVRVVGIIDDKTNLDKYKEMEDEEIMQDYGIQTVLNYSYIRLIYVVQEKYNELADKGSSIYYDIDLGQPENTGTYSFNSSELRNFSGADYLQSKENRELSNNWDWFRWDNESEKYVKYTQAEMEQRLADGYIWSIPEFDEYTLDEYLQDQGIWFKNGVSLDNMTKDQVLVPEWILSNYYSDLEDTINGGLKLKLKKRVEDDKSVAEYTVVGFSSSGYYFTEEGYAEAKELFAGYEFMISALNGNAEQDKAFVTRLENADKDGVKYAIQNSTTTMLNMLEEILIMMTSIFIWVAIGFAVFAALLLMNFISTSINYKKREIGVLRALGARGSDIFGIFFNESTLIAFINFALAAIATIVGCTVINSLIISKLGMEIALLNVGIRQVILILAVSWGSAFLASLLPTLKISRKKPIDAINNR